MPAKGDAKMRIVVVGAGILGASTAYHLARDGADVAIVDQAHEGQATAAGAGIICPWASSVDDPAFYELYAAGARYYTDLVPALSELGETDLGFRRVGALLVSTDPSELAPAETMLLRRRTEAPETLLAHRSLRIKNFAAIRLGRQLLRQGERYLLVFGPEETKTGQPWEAVFPETLLPGLARYLDHHRPVLLRGEHGTDPADIDALWVSEIGTHLELGALARRICIHTARAFGVSMPPHWFRDAAATTIAIEDPKHVRDAHLVLGHASLATTERHYNQARSLEASRRHQAMLAGLRASVKRGPI
jgi:hypothetical protein